MPPLRLLIIILILLNLLALAAGQGWLGTSGPRGEPERLTNQVDPDAIQLQPALPTSDAPAAAAATPPDPAPPPAPPAAALEPPPPPPAIDVQDPAPTRQPAPDPEPPPAGIASDLALPSCVAFALPQPQADALERLVHVAAGEVRTTRILVEPPNTWWVRIPPLASRQAAERRVRELRELGVADLFIVREPGPSQHAISLGLFRTEASARQHQSDLAAKRIRDAEVLARNPAVHRVEVRAARSTLDQITKRLATEMPFAIRNSCPNP